MDYTVIRSSRRSCGIEIRGGRVIVRAPRHMPNGEIRRIVESHRNWIEEKLRLSQRRSEAAEAAGGTLTDAELKELYERAKSVIPERVRLWAPLVGVTCGRITLRCQHTRWGSCSAKGNLNFNVLLMLAPPETLDAVVVHELCHRLQPNHSPAFYAEVLRVMPDYRARDRWLKVHGGELMARLPTE